MGEGDLNCSRRGQRGGRWRVRCRAGRVTRPGRWGWCRRRVSVAMIVSWSPILLVQRARLWAMTFSPSQAALAPNRPDGRCFNPTPSLRSRMMSSMTAWRR